MKQKQPTEAQRLLARIGGLAERVAGVDDVWYSDHQTPKKAHQRPLTGRGGNGKNLQAHFDRQRMEAKQRKQSKQRQLKEAA